MTHAEADDLAAIFFGDEHGHDTAPAGRPSQRDCSTSPCDFCDSCDSQAFMRVCGPVHGLRPAATGCDSSPSGLHQSQKIAGSRNGQNTPQTRASAQESQKSQQSQGSESRSAATTTDPAPEFLALVAWTDADIARFTARRDRLTRWGYRAAEAEALAERLTRRDRSDDDRVSCTDCRHYRPGRCGNHLTFAHAGRRCSLPVPRRG